MYKVTMYNVQRKLKITIYEKEIFQVEDRSNSAAVIQMACHRSYSVSAQCLGTIQLQRHPHGDDQE